MLQSHLPHNLLPAYGADERVNYGREEWAGQVVQGNNLVKIARSERECVVFDGKQMLMKGALKTL